MTFEELFSGVIEQSESQITAEFLLEDLQTAMGEFNQPGWEADEVKPEQLQNLMEAMKDSFMMSCAVLESTDDDPVYDEATEVAQVFCKILAEQFNVELEPPKIISFTEVAAQAGVVEIFRGEDGQKYVRLTPQGRAMVEEEVLKHVGR